MGWSWSLYFCHDVLTECMLAAEGRRGVPRGIAEQGVLRDHRAPPRLADNGVILAPYVDNANYITCNAAIAVSCIDALGNERRARGLAHRVEARAVTCLDAIGLRLDGLRLRVTSLPGAFGGCVGPCLPVWRVISGHVVHA